MKFNKLLSLILAFVFVFTTAIACFPGVSAMASTIELADGDYENAYNVLKSICPQIPLSDKDKTTREEFVAAVAMVLGVPDNVKITSNFTDVEDSTYKNEIAYAASMGIVSNVALFYPDTEVTYAQAIKIVMSAAGYGKKAELMGGYPVGYLKCANEAGVGAGLSLSDGDSISHGDAIKLIFEACCTDMMEVTSYGSSYNYTLTEGKNILSVYHGIYMAEGVVEANKHTGLEIASQATDDGYITVEGESYKGSGYDNLLGKRVRVLFKDDKPQTIIYAYEKDNTVTQYTGEDGLDISGTTLTAWPETSEKEIKHSLETDFKVVYNNKAYLAADYNSVINPVSGNVELIDNNDNKKIDVIVIKDIKYGIIGSLNALEGKIYDKYQKNALIDLGSSNVKYTVSDSDGIPLTLENLEPGDAIGYVMSSDKSSVDIIRQLKRLGGTYKSLSSDNKIEVKGNEYKLSEYYAQNVKSANDLKLNTEVILYLSSDDQVIFIQEYSTSLTYGFLVDVATGSGLDSTVMVKLFTSAGQMLEADVADKVVLDGSSKTSKTEIKDLLDTTVAKPYAYRVVKYSLNVEGKVNKIYTATDNLEGTAVLYKQPVDEARPVIYYDSTEVSGPIPDEGTVPYVLENTSCPYPVRNSFSYFHAGSGTKMMRIPVRPAQFNDEENFKIITSAPEAYVRTVAYDVTYGGVASFIIISTDTSAGSIGKYDGSAIIESITQGVNEEGEAVTVLKLFYGGEWDKYYYHPEKTMITKEKTGGDGTTAQTELTIADFAPGDIIRISADADKLIAEMTMNFDVSKREVASNLVQTTGNNGRYVEYIKGYALGYDQSRLVLATQNTLEEVIGLNGAVTIGNTYSGTLTRGTTVFVKFHRNRQTGAITSAEVYKEESTDCIETFFNAGKDADYIVLRQYFRDPSLNVIYTNIDE